MAEREGEQREGGRKSNQELAEREPEIEEAARGAIMNAQAVYGNTKVLSAEAIRDMDGTITGYEVVLAGKDKGVPQVMLVEHDASQGVTKYNVRSDEEGGDEATEKKFAKLDTPMKERQKQQQEEHAKARDERDAKDAEAKKQREDQKRESESRSER